MVQLRCKGLRSSQKMRGVAEALLSALLSSFLSVPSAAWLWGVSATNSRLLVSAFSSGRVVPDVLYRSEALWRHCHVQGRLLPAQRSVCQKNPRLVTKRGSKEPSLLVLEGGFGGGGRGSNDRDSGDGGDGDQSRGPSAGVVVAQWPPWANSDNEPELLAELQNDFSADQIPDVWNSRRTRRAVVTGANTGIGLEMAIQLASKGWHVVLACRNKKRGEAALEKVRKAVGDKARVHLMPLDTGDPESVRAFVSAYKLRYRDLHLLINNAGIMLNDFKISPWGVEQNFAVNYLGPFLLTTLLLPPLRHATSKDFPSRVVNVGSESLRFAPEGGVIFNVTTINDPDNYQTMEDKWMWYGHSKIALSLFTKELNVRLYDEDIYVNCCHPGLIKSDLFREAGECFPPFFGWVGRRMSAAAERWRRDVPNGALTPLYLATSPDIVHANVRGEYLVPCDGFVVPDWLNFVMNLALAPVGVFLPPGLRLEPWSTGSTVAPVVANEQQDANDLQLSEKLWEFSCALSEGGADMMDGKGQTTLTRLRDFAVGVGMVAATGMWFEPANMSRKDGDDDRLVDLRMPLIGNVKGDTETEIDQLDHGLESRMDRETKF